MDFPTECSMFLSPHVSQDEEEVKEENNNAHFKFFRAGKGEEDFFLFSQYNEELAGCWLMTNDRVYRH